MADKKNDVKSTPETPLSDRLHRGISFNIYLPFDELYIKQEFENVATAERRSISEVVIQVLKEHLDAKKKKK